MQYLLARFAETRKAIIDGIVEGVTNELLELEEGTHPAMSTIITFTLKRA